jgi:hypothetical protein
MAGLAAVISEDSEQRRLAHRLCSEAVQAYSSVLPEDHPVVMTSRLVLANAFEREQMYALLFHPYSFLSHTPYVITRTVSLTT